MSSGAQSDHLDEHEEEEHIHLPSGRQTSHHRPLRGGKCAWDDCGYREVSWALIVLSAALFVALLSVIIAFHDLKSNGDGEGGGSGANTCSGVCASRGMVATTNEYATRAAVEILRQNGNAVDAAAAAQFVLNVVQPQSTGIGGGCFMMLYHGQSGQTYAIDGREEAPEDAFGNMFCQNPDCVSNSSCTCATGAWRFWPERVTGGRSVGVPGTLAAVSRMLEDHGTMTLSQVLQPAIKLARDGFPMYDYLHDRLMQNKERLQLFPASAALFYPNNGEPVAVGETFRNPDLADTFAAIAQFGPSYFYTGALANDIVQAARQAVNPVTNLGGLMKLSDLARYKAVYRAPVRTTYRNYTVLGMPPSSGGGLSLGMMLNVLEQFDMSSMVYGSTAYLRRLIDAQDIVFADRNQYMADADWVTVPLTMLDKSYARSRATSLMKAVNAAGAPLPYGTPPSSSPLPRHASSKLSTRHGTTHMSLGDAQGNLVAFTTTIEENLGSGVVVPNRGFLLNNELTDFDGTAADATSGLLYANRVQGGSKLRRTALGSDAQTSGGKRPRSTMTPTLVLKGSSTFGVTTPEPYLAIGSPGGSRITGYVLNVLLGLLDFNMSLYDATKAPRMVSRNSFADAERNTHVQFPNATVEWLTSLGYDVRQDPIRRPHGFVQTVRKLPTGGYEGMADITRLPVALAMGV